MKGKIAFVLGAAVGYVLGSRAGRERYEQIKNGAQTLWHTAPVQRGVGAVRDVAQTRVDDLKASAVRAGKNAMAAFLHDDGTDKNADGAARRGASSHTAKPASGSGSRSESASATTAKQSSGSSSANQGDSSAASNAGGDA